jgi:hypothetical protein
MREKIAVGLGTVAGLVGACAAALVLLVGELADASAPLGVPAEVWPVVSAALLTVVVLGRMAQAVALALRGPEKPSTTFALTSSSAPIRPEEG